MYINHMKSFTLAVVIAACLGRQAEMETRSSLTTWVLGLSERSVMTGGWVCTYIFLVKFILSNKSGRLRAWVKDFRASTNSAMTKVSSSETVSRIRSSVAGSSCVRLLGLAGCGGKHEDRTMIISAKESFMSLGEISDLSLVDLRELFNYGRQINNTSTFNRDEYISTVGPLLRLTIKALDEVTASSRGGVPLPESQNDMDAFYYAAVLRIFAEWRSARLVPQCSSQRYSLGMGLARRDLIQNIDKIETAAHQWLLYRECASFQDHSCILESPTLRQLLEHEVQQKLHKRLPCLVDQSAASGLLWSKRQLQYQSNLFENGLQVPYAFSDSKAAITAAYKATYDNYHGFFVRQIFQNAFEAAPDAQVIYQFMSRSSDPGNDLVEAEDQIGLDDENNNSNSKSFWIQFPVDDFKGGEDARDFPPPVKEHQIHPVHQFVHNLFSHCVGIEGDSQSSRDIMRTVPDRQESVMSDSSSIKQIGSTVEIDIPAYLSVVQPIVSELSELISCFNMNDPTKV